MCIRDRAYRSSVVGSHEAVLEISGGGLKSPIIVNLKGQAIDDFVALPAKDIGADEKISPQARRDLYPQNPVLPSTH